MSFINLEQLPFVGMSYEFAGETQGAPFSAYIVKAKPGQGPPLHKHPYVEVAFTLEGRATITVGDEQREVKAGGIVVIPAETPHRFVKSFLPTFASECQMFRACCPKLFVVCVQRAIR
jgi:mannose-6-phosphate isomerase-like protein (cupin superfamily)